MISQNLSDSKYPKFPEKLKIFNATIFTYFSKKFPQIILKPLHQITSKFSRNHIKIPDNFAMESNVRGNFSNILNIFWKIIYERFYGICTKSFEENSKNLQIILGNFTVLESREFFNRTAENFMLISNSTIRHL